MVILAFHIKFFFQFRHREQRIVCYRSDNFPLMIKSSTISHTHVPMEYGILVAKSTVVSHSVMIKLYE